MSRYYTPDDIVKEECASVTTVLSILDKPALVQWAARTVAEYLLRHADELGGDVTEARVKAIIKEAQNEYKEVSAKALDIGSRTHLAVELFLKNKPHLVDKDIDKPFYAFVDWAVENDFHVEATEQKVYHKVGNLPYAGTCDLIGTLRGMRYLIDLKTSAGFYEPEMPCQLAAYAAAIEGIQGIGVVRLDKASGMPFWKDYTGERELAWLTFCDLLRVFYRHYARKDLRR